MVLIVFNVTGLVQQGVQDSSGTADVKSDTHFRHHDTQTAGVPHQPPKQHPGGVDVHAATRTHLEWTVSDPGLKAKHTGS